MELESKKSTCKGRNLSNCLTIFFSVYSSNLETRLLIKAHSQEFETLVPSSTMSSRKVRRSKRAFAGSKVRKALNRGFTSLPQELYIEIISYLPAYPIPLEK